MNVASLELCKELYELSGWDMTRFKYTGFKRPLIVDGLSSIRTEFGDAPAYDLGYLLKTLPSYIEQDRLKLDGIDRQRRVALQLRKWERPEVVWFAEYHEIYYTPLARAEADTPENAACKLAIELFKQGVLTK